MDNEFLIRVDEELPSDEKTAVRIIETKVISDEYRLKLESVIDKLESVSAINNADVLRDMKDILAGLLDSITAINSKYNFLSEMMLKTDDARSEISDRISKLSAGIADILADIQTSIAGIKAKQTDVLVSDSILKMEEKLNELSVAAAELGEKVESMSGDHREVLDRLEERLGDISVSHASMNEKLEFLDGLDEKTDRLSNRIENKMGELSVGVAEMDEKISELAGLGEAVGGMRVSVADLESRTEPLKGLLEGMDEKLSNVSVANSELLGNISDSIRNIENRHGAISDTLSKLDEKLIELSSSNADTLARIDEKLRKIEKPSVEIDTSGLASALETLDDKVKGIYSVIENLNDKINDALIQNRELSDKLDQLPGGLSEDELARMERKVAAALESANSDMLDKMDKRLQLASEETHRLRRAVDDIDTRLKKQNEELLAAISALRQKAAAKPRRRRKAKKMPAPKRAARRRRIARRRVARRAPRITDEALDVLIVNTLNAASMNLGQLHEMTRISEKKLRERLDVLMARGVVVRERRGRSIFYVSQAEQPMPTG